MFDIRIFNINVGTYLRITPEKALENAEKENKDLCLQDFLERRQTFTTMVDSAYIIPGAEALAAQKIMAALLGYKLKKEYSEIYVFVRASMSLAIVRSNSLILCRPRDKGVCIQKQPELKDGAVMVMLTHWQDKIKGRPQGTTG